MCHNAPHRLGCFCTHDRLGGGDQIRPPPPAILRTNGRIETREAAFERSHSRCTYILLNIFNLRSNVRSRSGQRSKLSVFTFCPLDTAKCAAQVPNCGTVLSRAWERHCMNPSSILSTGQGQGQATEGHQRPTFPKRYMIHDL